MKRAPPLSRMVNVVMIGARGDRHLSRHHNIYHALARATAWAAVNDNRSIVECNRGTIWDSQGMNHVRFYQRISRAKN